MSKPSLEDYIEVPERISRFYEQYPDGSLQGSWEIVEVGGDTLIVYTARAFRTSADERPGVGTASEPYPGKTAFTKGSELMNAETSAWGRAIVALGFLAKNEKVASKEEVKLAQERQPRKNGAAPLADKAAALDGTVEVLGQEKYTNLAAAAKEKGITPKQWRTKLTALGITGPDDFPVEKAEEVEKWISAGAGA